MKRDIGKLLHNWRVLLLKRENDLHYVYIKVLGVSYHFIPWLANSAHHIFRITLHLVGQSTHLLVCVSVCSERNCCIRWACWLLWSVNWRWLSHNSDNSFLFKREWLIIKNIRLLFQTDWGKVNTRAWRFDYFATRGPYNNILVR